jgi:diguanylate cyclase
MKDIVELGLKRPGAREDVGLTAATTVETPVAVQPRRDNEAAYPRGEQNLVAFLDRLMATLVTLAPDADAADTDNFRAKLDEYRQTILDPSRRMEVPRVTEACILACQQYLKLSRHYHAEREHELTELIGILREAAKLSIGDSSDFNAQLMASSDRFGGLVQLDDVRELKRKLMQEVTVFRQSVEEKQKRDERAYAQLNHKVEALQSKLSEVEEEAATDSLTRVGNRGRFQRTLTRWVDAAREAGTPLSIAMIDVDNFKQINDTHGHPIGDRVLLCTAQSLSKGVRQTDFVARYGGEEFVILLPNASASQVEDRLAKLVESIAASHYDYDLLGKRETVRFTVSCGLTELFPNESEEEMVKRADEALYEAKRKGKNRVVTKKRSLFESLMSWG